MNEIHRQRREDIERLRENLSKSANLRNLVLEDLESQKALVNGIKKVPEAKVIEQAQQLEHKVLPQILQKYGAENEQYVYWKGVLDSLLWLIHITDYSIRLEEKISRTKHELNYYKSLTARIEMELQTYTSMDRFLTTELITSLPKQ